MANPVCVITGASRGIGLATALRFAAARHHIVAAARNLEELGRARQRIESAGVACESVEADVARPEGARSVVEAALQRFGRLDVLVNNAGVATLAPLPELPGDDFERMLAVNCAAVFHTCQAAWSALRQRAGVIVNVSSVSAIDPFPGFAVYAGTKAWVNAFTRGLALEGRAHGVRVYAVAPGAVETDMLRAVAPNFPAEQCLSADDVAGVIEAVCDPRLGHCSGETIYVRH